MADLRNVVQKRAAQVTKVPKPRRVATPANPPENPYAQHNSDTCAVCEKPIFYSVSMSEGSKWLHNDTYKIRCGPLTKER